MTSHARTAAVYLFLVILGFSTPVFSSEVPVISLPDAVGGWKRSAPTEIRPSGVFDYMDGAGELYLAYNFVRLDVYRYTSAGNGSILVEIYQMPSSDDAWGLLSGDWGGEAVVLSKDQPALQTYDGRVPAARALYGAGLLRLAADNLYARLMAERETEDSHRAVIELGRVIAAARRLPSPPDLVSLLPARLPDVHLLSDRVLFFRTHLVLNSVYYLSSSNILALDNQCEAVTAAYRQHETAGKPNAQVLIIRYPAVASAQKALKSFLESYLPEVKEKPGGEMVSKQVEDGWVSVSRRQSYLALVFRGASRAAAERLVSEALAGVQSVEGSDEHHP
jgi:hypothetical protein